MLNIKLLEQNIENSVQKDLADGNIGGCALIVKEGGKTVFKKCYG